MKKFIWITVILVTLCFCGISWTSVVAQSTEAKKPNISTRQQSKTEKPSVEKSTTEPSRQSAERSKKNGKKIIIPGKDLS